MTRQPDPFSMWHALPGVIIAAVSLAFLWWLRHDKEGV